MQPNDSANENFLFSKYLPRRCTYKKKIMLIMYEFAPTCLMSNPYRICRCECSQMMVQMKISCLVNVFQEETYANFYARDADV